MVCLSTHNLHEARKKLFDPNVAKPPQGLLEMPFSRLALPAVHGSRWPASTLGYD